MISGLRTGRTKVTALALAATAAACLSLASEGFAQATLVAPQKVTERDTIGLSEITSDPFGNVYAISNEPFNSSTLLKLKSDLTPVFDHEISFGRAIATDSAGRLFVAGNTELRRYTSSGGLLGAWDLAGGIPGGMSSDSSDHFYLPEFAAGGNPVLNEYAVVAGAPTIVASTPYVGTPNGGFIPITFFETAVDAERDVYASGVTQAPVTRFIYRYGPDLTGSPFTLKSCPLGNAGCGWANGLDVVRLQTINGPGDYLVADNYLSGNLQVYSTGPSGAPVGTLMVDNEPGSPTAIPTDFASSDCTGSFYVLLSVFGNPGNTFSGSRIQRYSTGASTGPCPKPPLVAIAGLGKQKYKLIPKVGADGPCVPCIVLDKSGAEVDARPARRLAVAATGDRRAKGLKLSFEATVAGDVRFLFRGPTEGRGKPKRRGGFLYAAEAASNKLTFTGVLRKGKTLGPGTYKTNVTDAEGNTLEKFKTKVLKR